MVKLNDQTIIILMQSPSHLPLLLRRLAISVLACLPEDLASFLPIMPHLLILPELEVDPIVDRELLREELLLWWLMVKGVLLVAVDSWLL